MSGVTELHPGDDRLMTLALDEVGDAERTMLVDHLARCASCRSEYDALSATIERTLAAAPSVPPPVGFEQRVLDAMGFSATQEAGVRRIAPRRTARWGLVAASLALGAGLGAGITYQVAHEAAPAPVVTAQDRLLTTPAGDRVGTVAHSYLDGSSVLVISLTDGKPGMTYECRARLADGGTVRLGEWTVGSERAGTWLVHEPPGNASSVELVANGGAGPVWSRARL
jgi:anti-sigma factor RsiW